MLGCIEQPRHSLLGQGGLEAKGKGRECQRTFRPRGTQGRNRQADQNCILQPGQAVPPRSQQWQGGSPRRVFRACSCVCLSPLEAAHNFREMAEASRPRQRPCEVVLPALLAGARGGDNEGGAACRGDEPGRTRCVGSSQTPSSRQRPNHGNFLLAGNHDLVRR